MPRPERRRNPFVDRWLEFRLFLGDLRSMRASAPAFLIVTAACVSGTPPGTGAPCAPAAFQGVGSPEGRITSEVACLTESLHIDAMAVAEIAFPNLTEIDGDLVIQDCPALESLTMPALRRVTGSVIVISSPQLKTLDLSKVEQIGDDFIVGVEWADEAVGTGVKDLILPSLREIGNELHIRANRGLASVSLPALEVVRGPTHLEANPTLDALRIAPEARLHDLRIENNTALSTLAQLAGRIRIDGDLVIRRQPHLSTLDGLNELTEVRGLLEISDNPALQVVKTSVLTRLGGLRIGDNAALTEVSLTGLTEADGTVELSHNPALRRIDWGPTPTVKGSFDIVANPSLEALDLSAVTRIDGDLGLVDLPRLAKLNAPNLQTVQSDLVVRGTTALKGLTLPGLQSVAGHLILQDNGALVSLGELSALERVGEQIYVHDNPKLPACATPRFEARLQAPPRSKTDQANNGPRCR